MWQSVTTTENLEFEVTGLFEGNQYHFRVAAENSIGVGDYTELQQTVQPKCQFSKKIRTHSFILV